VPVASSVAHPRSGLKAETDRSIFRVFFAAEPLYPAQNPQKSAISVPENIHNGGKVWIIS